MAWRTAIPFFFENELACRCCGKIELDNGFAAALPFLRLAWGKPLTPSSVCRCPDRNKGEGGHVRSLHLTENPVHKDCMDRPMATAAADIKWRSWPTDEKLRFARLAYKLGFSIGLHDGFCHVDWRRSAGLRQAVYTYSSWGGAFDRQEVL